jgi:hypothetical protein
MDTTITYDEVATLIGVNIPLLEPCPTSEKIRALRRHFEQALQRLPCPQSTLHGWKDLIMSRELYALLTSLNKAFCLPLNPSPNADYTRPVALGAVLDLTPLSHTKQATIDMRFAHQKHYLLLLQKIKRACFTALDASINDVFKVSTDPTIQGWHAGMTVQEILNQLSSIYGLPTPAAMELSDITFR